MYGREFVARSCAVRLTSVFLVGGATVGCMDGGGVYSGTPTGDSGVHIEAGYGIRGSAAPDSGVGIAGSEDPDSGVGLTGSSVGAQVLDGGNATPRTPPIVVSTGDFALATPIHSGDSVFFVGNSFFGGDDDRLADFVAAMGTAVQPPIVINVGQHVVYGNEHLEWFFQQPESQNAINSGRYEVFVLQGEEREPVDHPDLFQQGVRDYYAAVTAHGGRVLLFMTWDFIWESGTTFFQTLSSAYESIGRELGIPVIPVGLIYDDCNKDPFGDAQPYWLTNQALHPSEEGKAVNAYATFAMLTGINPMGMPVTKPGYVPSKPMSPELYRYLSDKSWARVEPRLAK